MKTAREIALETLFGNTPPDKRWTPKTTLQKLGQRYPDLMGSVANHAAARLDELGDDVSEAQLLLIQKEGEALGLQSAVADMILREGLVTEKGEAHPLMGVYLRLNEQVLRMITTLGIRPVKAMAKSDEQASALAAWNKALSTIGTTGSTKPADISGDADTDTSDNAGQMGVDASEGVSNE